MKLTEVQKIMLAELIAQEQERAYKAGDDFAHGQWADIFEKLDLPSEIVTRR